MHTLSEASTVPAMVLDTNVALDWLVFGDARAAAVARAIQAGRVRWLASPAMRQELQHMLHHHSLARWQPDTATALATFGAHALLLPEPVPGAGQRLACSDPDDQVFIDLALAHGARWLLTHDRAVLKLARRARLRGLEIVPPEAWAISAEPRVTAG